MMSTRQHLEDLLDQYRSGALSRRSFLRAAMSLGLAAPAAALLASGATASSTGDAQAWAIPRPAQGDAEGDFTINLAMVEEPPELDPHNLTAAAAGEIGFVVMPGLVWWDYDLGLSPMVAEGWQTSDDGLVWTFTLRPNVVFHNGKPCTAQEVVRNFEHIQDPASGSMLTPDFAALASVEAPDERTVVFTLSEPFAPFLAVLSHRVAITDMDAYDATKPIGTGPFKIVDWRRGTGLTLERHDQYWEEGLPHAKQVNWRYMPDDDVRLIALQAGEVDIMLDVPGKVIDQTIAQGDFNVDPIPGVTHQYLAFNCTDGPFADVKMRKAVAHAIDKEAILEVSNWGYATKTNIPFPPESPWYVEIPDYERDLDKARALVAEAGYEDGLDLDMPIPNWSPAPAVAEIVIADLGEIGINLRIVETEWATYWPDIYLQSKFPITFMGYSARVDPDQTFYPRYHSEGVHNATKYSNSRVDELLDQGRLTLDLEQRKAIYDEVQRILVDELPWLWLYLPDVTMGWTENVSGFRQHPAAHVYLKDVTIQR